MSRSVLKMLNHERELHKIEINRLIQDYEIKLETERARVQALTKEWSDRFLQLQGLNPMMVTDLEPESVPRFKKLEARIEDSMGYDARQLFLDRKDQFFDDGLEEGMDEESIRRKWLELQDQIAMDVQSAIV